MTTCSANTLDRLVNISRFATAGTYNSIDRYHISWAPSDMLIQRNALEAVAQLSQAISLSVEAALYGDLPE